MYVNEFTVLYNFMYICSSIYTYIHNQACILHVRIVKLLSGYPDPNIHEYPTDSDIISLMLYI